MTVYINGTTGYSGPVGTIGDLTTTGNTTLGDASSDTLTLNGNTASIPNNLNFTSGNIGIGVAPSAWNSSWKALQTNNGYIGNATSNNIAIGGNNYVDSGGAYRYITSAAANQYQLAADGSHFWRIAGSGTAGNAITWTQAMTLDANGILGVNVTPASGWQTGRSAIQLGTAALDTYTAGQLVVRANNYWNGTNDKYISNGYATVYEQTSGTHRWYTSASGTAGNNVSFSQIMMLDTSGNLGIGQTTPAAKLDVLSSASRAALITTSAGGSYGALHIVNTTNTAEASIGYRDSADTDATSWVAGKSVNAIDAFGWYYGGAKMTLVPTGALALAGGNTSATGTGIVFPSSYNASSDVNTLDDYEEGDWTPRLSGSGGGNYTPSGVNAGRYIKIGKMVWATASLQWSAVVTAYSGNLVVSGLPFTSAGGRASGSMGAVSSGLSFTAGYSEWNYLMDPGFTFVYIIQNATGGSGYSHTPTVSSSGIVYALSVVYEAA